MTRIALAVVPRLEARLLDQVARHGHVATGAVPDAGALAALIAKGECEAAIISADPSHLDRRLLSAADGAGVRLVGLSSTEADRRHAASVGLHEVVAEDSTWARIEELLTGGAPPASSLRRTTRGEAIVVWGPAGAPGRTTTAIALAAELASAGNSVVLADADTHNASIAPALGLLDESPGFAAACRLAGARGLTVPELERIGQRYTSGHGSFWVLTGLGRPSRWPELTTERVTETIRRCREWVDYVVVDVGSSLESDEEISSDLFAPRRNASTLAALREADRVVAVGSADPVGLSRFLRAHVELVEAITTDQVTVVMNRVRTSAIGMNAGSQVRQTLRRFGAIPSAVLVPYDRKAVDTAILEGRTLVDVAPRSGARAAVAELADTMTRTPEEIAVAPRTRRSRGRRAASAVG